MVTGSRRSTSPRHRPGVNGPYRAESSVSSTLSETAVASSPAPPPSCAAFCRTSHAQHAAWAERAVLKEQKSSASHERDGKNANPPHERPPRRRNVPEGARGCRPASRQSRVSEEEDTLAAGDGASLNARCE